MKHLIISGLAAIGAASAFAVSAVKPQINDLKVEQNGSRIVQITYKLANEPAVVTVDIQTNSLPNGAGTWASIGGENITSALSGDCCKLIANGDDTRTIVWRPRVSWPNNFFKDGMAKAVVTAWATNEPPTFMVVDLTNTVQRFTYYADKSFLPGGITNRMYKTDKILFRRIPAAGVTWNMGSPSTEAQRSSNEDLHNVTLTEDYYMAVYETTMKQYRTVQAYYENHKASGDPAWLIYFVENYKSSGYDAAMKEVCPYNTSLYFNLRGSDDNLYNWPANGHDVAQNAFFGTLRVMTGGGVLFDLPTDAHWEFAARAGTSSQAYFGVAYNGNWNPNTANLNANTWWYGNASIYEEGTEEACHPVGEKTANAFDLYDVLGNVMESCLDQYTENLGSEAAVDPKGPTTGSENPKRVVRGGTIVKVGDSDHFRRWVIRSAFRGGCEQVDDNFWGESKHGWGFRIWAPAVAK